MESAIIEKTKGLSLYVERNPLVRSHKTVEDRLTVYEARTLMIKMEKLQKSMMV